MSGWSTRMRPPIGADMGAEAGEHHWASSHNDLTHCTHRLGSACDTAFMEPEESPSIPNHGETQRQGCLVNGLRFGFWFWAWLYGYFLLVLLFAYGTRPIVGDDLINQNGFLVAVAAMILMGVGVFFGNRQWRTIPLGYLIAANIIGPASFVVPYLIS
jgi:hypothetical protein